MKLTINGLTSEYAVFGRGERTLVLLPGISVKPAVSVLSTWEKEYAAFTEDYTVLLLDRPENPPEHYGISRMADDTAAVLDRLGVKNADFIGISQGGMLAQLLAIRRPELVRRLALAATLCEPNAAINFVMRDWILTAREGNREVLANSLALRLGTERSFRAWRYVMRAALADASGAELRRFSILAEAARDFSCREELKTIKSPALVIAAEGDRVTTAKAAGDLADALGCEFVLYGDRYGHCVLDELPEARQRILEFFRQ